MARAVLWALGMKYNICLYLLAGLVTAAGEARAQTCAPKCSRWVECSSGYEKVTSSRGYVCKRKKTSSPKTPTCVKHNLRNDWKWSSSQKKCYRRKGRDTVFSTQNIRCPSGYALGSSGKCEDSKKYALPSTSTVKGISAAIAKSCSSSSSCTRKLTCKYGYRIKAVADGAFVCDLYPKDRAPTCGRFRNANDWQWDPRTRTCTRSGRRVNVSATANITCPSRWDYVASSGSCRARFSIQTDTPKFTK